MTSVSKEGDGHQEGYKMHVHSSNRQRGSPRLRKVDAA